ncbi:MAG: molybdenum cofactor guanylyltransferase [Solirubrobacterales bacterium]|nr:molybdenum cofactor guanylyltransferase [Solirubrobacterales bacterium]
MVHNACAIILAGGRSSRMGSPKAKLEWHGSTLLRRVTGIVARSIAPGPIVVVAADGQDLPALPGSVEVVLDAREGRGPLQGLAAGLAAVGERAGVAYVSSVDVPLLHPAFVRAVVEALGPGVDVAVPEVAGYRHPLAAAYRVSVRGVVEALLAEDRLAMSALLDRCRVRRLAGAELPAAESLTNLNSPGDYERALGVPAPSVRVDGSSMRAWTLGEVLGGRDRVTLNGVAVEPDPELPLVSGDRVDFS